MQIVSARHAAIRSFIRRSRVHCRSRRPHLTPICIPMPLLLSLPASIPTTYPQQPNHTEEVAGGRRNQKQNHTSAPTN